jgi:hypothetical protein
MTAYAVPVGLTPPKAATVYETAQAIAPADNTQIGPYTGLYVGGAGNVTVCMRNGDGTGGVTTVLFEAVPAGTVLPIAFQGVNATGTTATHLVGLA